MTFLSQVKVLSGAPFARGPRVAVFGDSHTAALLLAQQFTKRQHRYEHIRVHRLRKTKDGKTLGDCTLPDFCDEIRDFSENDSVFSAVGGSQYALPSTMRHPIDYDLADTGSLGLATAEGATLVPLRAMEAYFRQNLRETIEPVLNEIRRSTSAKVFHIVPPPPKQDNDFISAHLESRFVQDGFGQLGPSRPELRLKCWRLQLGQLQALCDELDIQLVMPPPQALTAEGYLEPFYYANDVTHANRRYGEQVLKQILELSGTVGEGAAT